MFDRYVLASNYKRITERFNMSHLNDPESYVPSFNIAAGQQTYVITDYQTKEILPFRFGLSGTGRNLQPFVRAEGDRNSRDDVNYTGSKAIFLKPEYRNLIRSQRCLVLADAFVVGVKTKPYLVYLRDRQRPFAFAGIWDTYQNNTGAMCYSFAIITVTANKLLQKLGYKRMPVILFQQDESSWLRASEALNHVISSLNPYPANLMNAYPISARISDKNMNETSLVKPTGKRVYYEKDYLRTEMVRPSRRKQETYKVELANKLIFGKN